ncbi:MAG: sigma-54 dependent transcriptional regulator [Myxococcales bacterium]|nr:sigma-54 dependent transcriptional regulator [Polyangiaceae bacterium]MDW8251761.1 sigma-54 dependent transcriptional regulator [Myxococcales bacterium]
MTREMTEEHAPIAVVEDDSTTRKVLKTWLEKEGFPVTEYTSGLQAIEQMHPDTALVCLDLSLGDLDGIEVLRRLCTQDPTRHVVVTTANTQVTTVVEAMKAGAFDYLTKPIDGRQLLASVRKALAHRAMLLQERTPDRLRHKMTSELVAQSPAMREIARHIARVLDNNIPVFLQGESGVGKGYIARLIHERGTEHRGPFITIDCATIPPPLQEAELVGQSPTVKANSIPGKLTLALNGTLFLDHVEALTTPAQMALLRFLQNRSLSQGQAGPGDQLAQVRIISATQCDLVDRVRAGQFREDLYYRLVVYPITIPPLRERIEDLPGLIGAMLRDMPGAEHRRIDRVSPDALDALGRYSWPGNLRELYNVLQRASLATTGTEIGLAHLPRELQDLLLTPLPRHSSTPPPLRPLRELEREAIRNAISASGGNMSAAAKILGVSRATLYRRINEARQLKRSERGEVSMQAPDDFPSEE